MHVEVKYIAAKITTQSCCLKEFIIDNWVRLQGLVNFNLPLNCTAELSSLLH